MAVVETVVFLGDLLTGSCKAQSGIEQPAKIAAVNAFASDTRTHFFMTEFPPARFAGGGGRSPFMLT